MRYVSRRRVAEGDVAVQMRHVVLLQNPGVPFADQMLVAVPEGVAPGTIASASDNLPDAWGAVGPYLAAMPGARILIGVAVSAVVHSRTGGRGWRIVLWISTVVIVILTFLSLLSIDVFLPPSTLFALLASALSLGARR